MAQSVFQIANVDEKLARVESECHELLLGVNVMPKIMGAPARSLPVVSSNEMPKRAGLQLAAGQARLLHDLANIELQAMELGLRTLHEFSQTTPDFRAGIAEIVLEEARHLRLCIDGCRELGYEWGSWPAHNTLWDATSRDDSLLDRIMIVNCYLEASGLDSGGAILRKLSGVLNPLPREIVSVIARDEVGHVRFGLDWYREFCRQEKLNSSDDFSIRLNRLFHRLPTRASQVCEDTRREAGFLPNEIVVVKDFNFRKQTAARAQLN